MNTASFASFNLLLAQTGGAASAPAADAPAAAAPARSNVEIPGLPTTGQPAAAPGAAVVPGGTTLAPAPGARPAGSMDFTLPIIIGGMFLFLILTSVLGGRKEKKKRAELMASLAKDDRVQTIGGVLGTIVEVRDDEVVLRVDENTNTRIRFARSAIQQVVRKANAPAGADAASQTESKPGRAKATV